MVEEEYEECFQETMFLERVFGVFSLNLTSCLHIFRVHTHILTKNHLLYYIFFLKKNGGETMPFFLFTVVIGIE